MARRAPDGRVLGWEGTARSHDLIKGEINGLATI